MVRLPPPNSRSSSIIAESCRTSCSARSPASNSPVPTPFPATPPKRRPFTRISSPSGKTLTPTSPSSRKPRRSTRSCNNSVAIFQPSLTCLHKNCQLTLSGVAVEKLLSAKFAKIKSRSEALQATFSGRLDIFYPPNVACSGGNRVFQQPQAFTLIDPFGDGSANPAVGFDLGASVN